MIQTSAVHVELATIPPRYTRQEPVLAVDGDDEGGRKNYHHQDMFDGHGLCFASTDQKTDLEN